MKTLLETIQKLNLTNDIKSLLRTIVSDSNVRLQATESEKSKSVGFNIFGIQCFNIAQLKADETFKALEDAVASQSHLRMMINHDSEQHATPLVWIGQNSGNTQSKEEKQELFS